MTTTDIPSPNSSTVWRNRDFRLVWTGGLVNDIGDWLLVVALPLYVFTRTGSGTTTAMLFLVEMAPAVLLGSVAGGFVDRWNLRTTLIATNVLQAVALLPLLAVTADRIWPAFVVAAVQAVLTRFNNPAKAAFLPRIVGAEHLVAANSAVAVSENMSRLIGSPLGGIVVGVGGLEAVLVADGISFLLVALATTRVRADGAALQRHEHARASRVGDLRDGFDVIRRVRPLGALLVASFLAQVSQGLFLVLFIAFVVRRLHGSEADVGLIRGMQAVGGIPGAFVVGRLARRAHAGTVAGFGFLGMAIAGCLFWNGPAVTLALPLYMGLFALAGPAAVACGVGMMTAAQQFTPPPFLGRVIGTVDAVAAAGVAIGTTAAGLLVDRVNMTWLLHVQVLCYVGCAVIALVAVARVATPSV